MTQTPNEASLRQKALQYVAANQPCKPNDLLRWLKKEQGASHQMANVTMLRMVHDGDVKRTATGKLTLP